MAELFETTKQNISLHLKNIFAEGELEENSVVKDFLTTARDGKKYSTNFYNLDAIISIGYRINSTKATQFRIWATKTLKNYLTEGYVINKNLLQQQKEKFATLQQTVDLLNRSLINQVETLKQAYILMRNENFFSVRMEKAEKELNKAKKNFYSIDMFEFEKLFFNRTSLEPQKYCEQILNITKKYSIDINKYSEIYNFISIVNCNTKLEPYEKNFLKDFNYLVQKMKNYAPFDVYEKFIKEFKNKNIEDNLIYCYKLTNKFLSQKEKDYYSYIDILIQKHNFENIFDISKYLNEEESFYNDIADKIFKTEEEKNIAFICQMLFLTEKYTKLNIDFYNFDKFTANKNKFIDILNKTDYIKNSEKKLEYRTTFKRDTKRSRICWCRNRNI